MQAAATNEHVIAAAEKVTPENWDSPTIHDDQLHRDHYSQIALLFPHERALRMLRHRHTAGLNLFTYNSVETRSMFYA
jgi:hypothetical protein